MAGSTPAPWSIPYPTGPDKVTDGDNAMQAIAERVAVICNALPRGLISTITTSAPFIAGDTVLSTIPSFTTTEARDFALRWFGQIYPYTGAPATGILFYPEKDGAAVGAASYQSWNGENVSNYYLFEWILPNVPAGVQNYRLHVAATGSNGHTISAGARLTMIDLGASGAI